MNCVIEKCRICSSALYCLTKSLRLCSCVILCPCYKQAAGEERLKGKSIALQSTLPDMTLSDLDKGTEGNQEFIVQCK